jgi:tetrapyrrole methylase family protein/MazG family protein
MPQDLSSITDPFRRLVAIMERLLGPDGCPWDRRQTHETLIAYLIEETYEVKEEIEKQNWDNVSGELGDVALQVVFHAALAQRAGRFDIDDVMNSICEKLIRRHPHVFGELAEGDELSVGQVLDNWEKIKETEKGGRVPSAQTPWRSVLAGVPDSMPALQRAQRLQEKAAHVGFDWDKIEDVWRKVEEELGELREAHESGDAASFEHELGDLLFALVNLSRFRKTWAEFALDGAAKRFQRRFQHIEETARREGRELVTMTLEEMDALWDEAKLKERVAADQTGAAPGQPEANA